jgi:predicted ATP-grasp superfamily ATP-dependent carboligase
VTRPPVLVTDGEQRAALAVVRCLGGAGHPVLLAHTEPKALAAASRFVARRIRVPSPAADPAGWRDAVRAAVRAHGARVIVPVTEPGLLAALAPDARLGDAVVAGPGLEAFDAIRDKEALLERAASLGIDVPRQHVVAARDDVDAALAVGLPAVLKPTRSMFEENGRLEKATVGYARTTGELRHALATMPAGAFPVLVQELVRGPGLGIFGLRWNGQRLATFAHRRVREKPPWGGVSVCSESVPLPEALADQAYRLLESYAWQGVAMVEYKVDEPTGRTVLMEVNGRFWGSLQLAIHAGVRFPRLLVAAALGTPAPPVTAYRVGVRNHWEWGEVDAALLRWRKDDPVTGRRGSLGRALAGTLAVRPGRDRAEVFRLTDPLPFARESLAWLKRG